MFIVVLAISVMIIDAGPIAYGVCQAGCSAAVVSCYAAAGFTFGTVTAGIGTPAAIVACNVAFGKCCAACAVLALAPIP